MKVPIVTKWWILLEPYKEAFLLGQFSCPPPGAHLLKKAQVQSVRHGPSIEELQGHLLQPRPSITFWCNVWIGGPISWVKGPKVSVVIRNSITPKTELNHYSSSWSKTTCESPSFYRKNMGNPLSFNPWKTKWLPWGMGGKLSADALRCFMC